MTHDEPVLGTCPVVTTAGTTGADRPGRARVTPWQRPSALGAGLVLAIALTACGGDASAPASGTAPAASGSGAGGGQASAQGDAERADAEHADADVRFAQDMIVHHRGALVMADLAQERAEQPEVRALAERISDAQEPEIETMTSWLETWGEDVPEGTGDGGHGTGEKAAHGSGGMDAETSLAALEAAPAAQFDHAFLEMMIEHHEGAVEMARREQAEGRYAEALDLAAEIASSQAREIEEMRQLLTSV